VTLHKSWSGPALEIGWISTLIVTSSVELGHAPLEIVHLNVDEPPMVKPLTVDVSEEGVSAVPVPEMVDHAPVPTAGAFPAKVAVVTLHKFWSGPAAAVVGIPATLMTMSSVDAGHTPLLIVHLNVDEPLMVNPLAVDVGSATTSALPVPDTVDHAPVPVVGVLAAKVVVITLHKLWSGPAAATVGLASTETVTSSKELGQVPFEIVQRKMADASNTNPVTVDVGDDGVVIVAAPAITVQFPMPTVGMFPANVVVVVAQRFWSRPAAAVVGKS
ncbi:MAG: hypothetical protein JKY68_07790, partial [Rhodospirillales bacterium]|nr:hypothetical protein [Rhodospirillales bacterium]